jgi:hypothetical protein
MKKIAGEKNYRLVKSATALSHYQTAKTEILALEAILDAHPLPRGRQFPRAVEADRLFWRGMDALESALGSEAFMKEGTRPLRPQRRINRQKARALRAEKPQKRHKEYKRISMAAGATALSHYQKAQAAFLAIKNTQAYTASSGSLPAVVFSGGPLDPVANHWRHMSYHIGFLSKPVSFEFWSSRPESHRRRPAPDEFGRVKMTEPSSYWHWMSART